LLWTHHAACRFPALRAPICFMPRLMGPILLGQLSASVFHPIAANQPRVSLLRRSQPKPFRFCACARWRLLPKRQEGSAFTLTYILRFRSCKSMDAFVISSLPSLRRRLCKWQGPFAPRTLLRFIATTDRGGWLSRDSVSPSISGASAG